ncbi:hypothetical protein BgiBS90_036473 [Biomphalaria glabrata]|nr:hypothetical protein BgiBS90_036473 [Biomphalaria glabrata]
MTSNKLSPSSVDIPVNTTTLPDVPTESLTTQDQHETTAPLSIFTPPYPPEASLSSIPHDFFKCPKLPETSTSAVISQASTSSAAFSPDSVTYSVSITAILPDASTSYSAATSPAASSTFQILPEISSSTLPQSPPETPSSTSINLNSQQLNALKENSLFICDKMSRDELIMFHTRLAAPQDQSFLDPYLERKFEEFKRVIQSLVNVFKVYEEPPSKVTLTEGNILTLLPINGKKRKKRNRITPNLPSLLSSEEFGSASDKKSEENESDKRKVAKKLRREEKKTNNDNAFIKLIQEMENIESHAHKDEHNGKKKGRKQMKKLTSINITQDRDSDANSAVRKEMKEELAVNSDEALDYSDHQTNGSCLGCGQNYGGELLVQCEVCDSWWHKECTKTANNFNNKEQGFTFVCIQCCPDRLS